MFFKKKKEVEKLESKLLLGMIILKDDNTFDLNNFIKDYTQNYTNKIKEATGDNYSAAFEIEGEMVAIGHMSVPIPSGDIEETAKYAYNWETALFDTKNHKSHLIISIIKGGHNQIKKYKIFTEIICSLLRTTNAIGVYKGNQSLLIPKFDYLNEAEFMSEDYLPLNLWIYFGLRKNEKGNSGYTYGLKEFNKTEMEVLNSKRSLEDIRGFLFNMASYVLDYDVTFKDGQTCGLSEDEKILIRFSKAVFVESNTFKLEY
jgi:hypothetical protein